MEVQSAPVADTTRHDSAVRAIMNVESITTGSNDKGYLVKYVGRIISDDTERAYDQLSAALEPSGITPLFRWEGDRHVVFLAPGRPKPAPDKPLVNLVLFILTVISVLVAGALYGLEGPMPQGAGEIVRTVVVRGAPFAISMLAILSAHEFAHFIAGRLHGVKVSLPFFIPLPLSPFGTMGAFINMREQPKNRKHLLDIGLAGPLAGLIVAIPILFYGLSTSTMNTLPVAVDPAGPSFSLEGNSLLYLGMKYVVFGQPLPQPVSYGDMSPVAYWLRFFFTGRPIPFGGQDVLINGVAWAGWAGILITGLNLIPAGQLDGGHLMYVLFGRKNALKVLPVILIGLALLGLVWYGWFLWVLLIFFLGRVHAEPLDEITPLDFKRKALAALGLVLFVLTFTPVPLNLF